VGQTYYVNPSYRKLLQTSIDTAKGKIKETLKKMANGGVASSGVTASKMKTQEMKKQVLNKIPPKASSCPCGTEYLPEARFCYKCGRASEDTCRCGAAFLPGAKFCCMCGTKKPDYNCNITRCSANTNASTATPHTASHSNGSSSPVLSTTSCNDDDVPALALDEPEEQTEVTTLMICDIPCRRSIEQVMEVVDMHGFANTYDLVYMPHQKGRRTQAQSQNVGYAFINFKESTWATAFMDVFVNVRFPSSSSEKLSYAKPARCQGFEANFEMHGRKPAAGALVTFRD